MKIVDCDVDRHGEAILAIFNDAILTSTALYVYRTRSRADIEAWFADKRAAGYPVIGAQGDDGALLGFASWGAFRSQPAYKYSVEHSVYVHRDHRRAGIAARLMEELIARAQAAELHVMIGAIDAANEASIALHRRFGFVHAGTLPQSGFKFGRWLDLALFQRILDGPSRPVDG